jgi:hypothetical protein
MHNESQCRISYGERCCPYQARKIFSGYHPGSRKVRFPMCGSIAIVSYRTISTGAKMHLYQGNSDIVIVASKLKDVHHFFFIRKVAWPFQALHGQIHIPPANSLMVALSKRERFSLARNSSIQLDSFAAKICHSYPSPPVAESFKSSSSVHASYISILRR